jgi:uncharacterized alkaline shock family protein YloU
MNISRETLKKIIELTAHEHNGDVWGDDTILGTMDELIDKALEIIKQDQIDQNND